MAENEQTPDITPEDTYENEDVKTIENMRNEYELKLAEEKKKYSSMLKWATERGTAPKAPEPEKPLNEQWEDCCKVVQDKRSTDLEIGKALLKGDEIYRQTHDGRSAFSSEHGVLDSREEKISDITAEILKECIDQANGDSKVFSSLIKAHLT